jgi:hypothetical protein
MSILRVCVTPGCGTRTLGQFCAAHEAAPSRQQWPRGKPGRLFEAVGASSDSPSVATFQFRPRVGAR